MPAGASQSATINYPLTEFAVGYMNDQQSVMALAERLIPTVSTNGASHGTFKLFNDLNSFKIKSTRRAMGGDPQRIAFSAADGRYDCEANALEVTVDEKERQDVGLDNPTSQALLDQGKVQALVNTQLISRAYERVQFVNANTTAIADFGDFTNPNIDPIDQIDAQLIALSQNVGALAMMAKIKITMGLAAWGAIRSHPKVKARLIGVQVTEISQDQFAAMFVVPVDFYVSTVSYSTGNYGQQTTTFDASKKNLIQDNLYLHIDYPNPTIYDPSGFKAFSTAGKNMITGVRSYMALNGLYGGHIVDWSEQLVQTSTIAFQRMALTLPSAYKSK
jgi:hypothetical protein